MMFYQTFGVINWVISNGIKQISLVEYYLQKTNQPFWKEKFLAKLPTLFGEKIRNKIWEIFGNYIIP